MIYLLVYSIVGGLIMLTNEMAPTFQWVYQHGMTNVVLCIKLSKQINPRISQLGPT